MGLESPAALVFNQSPPQSLPQIMVFVNKHVWIARTTLNLVTPLHDLPKNPEKVLPKFDPGKGVSAEDHLKGFYMDLTILNVDHEYVACILFP